ncbi:MAG TPA: methyltransferase, partial [Candidatus Caccousia avistercoris]|nr:methyltransferase [Candidatus Caccousia avistercoris]
MICTQIKGVPLSFQTDPALFSPHAIDAGTLAMLSVAEFQPGDKILDLGCGYGPVGILAAKLIGEENVVMCDISENAVQTAKTNAEINQVPDIRIVVSDGLK